MDFFLSKLDSPKAVTRLRDVSALAAFLNLGLSASGMRFLSHFNCFDGSNIFFTVSLSLNV